MTSQSSQPPQQPELEAAIRLRILTRAAIVNTKLMTRLATVAKDIEEGSAKDALSSLGGLERKVYAVRNLLLLAL
jgi:hypothetical protein